MKILVINPGSTSTLISIFEDEKEIKREKIEHDVNELRKFKELIDQLPYRKERIMEKLKEWGIKKGDLSAVAGRGGVFKPLESGTYEVNDKMIEDVKAGRVRAKHASNLGCILAKEIAEEYGVKAYIADPVSVDEFEPLARVSGLPEIEREALQHTLNIKAMARRAAKELKKPLSELNLVVAHIGGGISVCPLKGGRIIDANNAKEEGPFSPERTGGLPAYSLVELCYSGKYTREQMLRKIMGEGGLVAYLGTNSIKEVLKRIEQGDEKARFYLEAMAYQIAKEIGAMSTVLKGKVDAIILTGGGANAELLVNWIKERVSWIAQVLVYPGEHEMLALAQATLRVLRGEEKPKEYK